MKKRKMVDSEYDRLVQSLNITGPDEELDGFERFIHTKPIKFTCSSLALPPSGAEKSKGLSTRGYLE